MHKTTFFGRKNELKSLNDLTYKKSASLVVIEGRRRIGKSRLVAEFGKKYRFISFAGLAPNESNSAQLEREEFAKQLSTNLNFPALKADDWSSLFSALAKETSHGRVVILFDEISWMGAKDPNFLGKLKNAWDLEFKNNPELMLILCGSVSSWIDENILKSTGFMGRLSLVLDLKELHLNECNDLLNHIDFCESQYERFKILSVTGGIPRYIEEINPTKLSDENIKDMCFKTSGILYREFNDIFSDIFAKRSSIYEKITRALVDGKKEFAEIAEAIGMQKGGNLTAYLADLIKSGFIRRDYTWKISDKIESKLSHYRLCDNYLRFYLKYIENNKSKIEKGHFVDKSLTTLPAFDSIMGLQFENLVLNNRNMILEKLNIRPEDIINDNPYFQRSQTRVRGCQIDYLIQHKSNILYACEIKFSRDKVGSDIIKNVRNKLANLALPKGFAVIPVLIHVNGVSDFVIEQDYFSTIIDFGTFLKSDI